MKAALSTVSLDPLRAQHEQLRRRLRALIFEGRLQTGDRLPSIEILARRWGSHVPTVHRALVELQKEGLVVRCHGRGTFVAERTTRLRTLAFYSGENIDEHSDDSFLRAVRHALQKRLAHEGAQIAGWWDPRPRRAQASALPALAQEAGRRSFEALVSIDCSNAALPWLMRLPVATAFVTARAIPQAVNFDFEQFMGLAVDALRRLGCRSAGLLWPWAAQAEPPSRHSDLCGRFRALAAQQGIRVEPSWVIRPSRTARIRPGRQEARGYEFFKALWISGSRPEGVVLYPDYLTRGALLAMLELGLRVPRDVKIVTHRNTAGPFLCPVPAVFLESDEAAVADALLRQVKRQIRGEAPEKECVGFRVIKG